MGQGSGPSHRLTFGERSEVQRRVRAGETNAAAAVGCSSKSVQRLLRKTGGLKPSTKPRSPLRLSLSEREEISRGLLAGESRRVIAARLGRSPSTVAREVAAAGGRNPYRAWRADERARRRARRPKSTNRSLDRRRRQREFALNQVEIYFSVVQRKALTRSDFASLGELEERLLGFGKRYEAVAEPFEWKFTGRDLRKLLRKLPDREHPLAKAA